MNVKKREMILRGNQMKHIHNISKQIHKYVKLRIRMYILNRKILNYQQNQRLFKKIMNNYKENWKKLKLNMRKKILHWKNN